MICVIKVADCIVCYVCFSEGSISAETNPEEEQQINSNSANAHASELQQVDNVDSINGSSKIQIDTEDSEGTDDTKVIL